MDELIDDVIEVLKDSNQTLVWLRAIKTPVREVVPSSNRDELMRELIEHLKERNIITGAGGFMGTAEYPPVFIATSFTLTDEFFDKYCTPTRLSDGPYQMSLFNQEVA